MISIYLTPQSNLNKSGWVLDSGLSWEENDILGGKEPIGSEIVGMADATGTTSELWCLGILKLNFIG